MLMSRWRAFLRRLLAPARAERDLDAEVRSYAAMLADELEATGASPEEAGRRARLALGGVEPIKESVRDVRAGAPLEQIWRDVTHAARGLSRSPGFAATAILTIGLGIGVNISIFSVIDTTFLKPLPYERPHELIRLGHGTTPRPEPGVSVELRWDEVAEWREAHDIFQGVEASAVVRTRIWRERGEPIVLGGFTPGMPALLGVTPIAGRVFTPAEVRDGSPVVMIAEELWARGFDRRPDAIGARMTLGDQRLTIIGVLPTTFRYGFRLPGGQPVAWSGLGGPLQPASTNTTVILIMRLRSGLSLESAHERAAVVAARMQQARPEKVPWMPVLMPLDRARHGVVSDLQMPMSMLLATAGLVLLVACVNVANLLLTRGASRGRELALRAALGASRARLIRLLLAEGVVVAALGGLAAVLFAAVTLEALVAFIPARMQVWMFQVGMPELDGRVLAFALSVTSVVALLSATWPAMSSARTALRTSIGGGHQVAGTTRERRRLSRVLQALQVGVAFLLATTAGLFATSFATLVTTDLGFDSRGLGVIGFSLPQGRYPSGESRQFAIARALDRVRATPGVVQAAIGSTPASSLYGDMVRPGGTEKIATLSVRFVGPGYFETAGIRLIAGRDFGPEDHPGSPSVAIIDDDGARRLFGDESPLGRRFSYTKAIPETTIIGVVAPVKAWNFTRPLNRVETYLPVSQGSPQTSFILRAEHNLAATLASVRASLEVHDPAIRVTSAVAATEPYDTMETYTTPRFYLVLLSMFAVLALVTASVGLYGLLAHAVGQRRREIGVRVALGSTPRQVRSLVIREALAPVLAGIAAGGLAAWWTAGLIASLLYGIGPHDPRAFVAGAITLTVAAVFAAFVPLRRATGVDPIVALRAD